MGPRGQRVLPLGGGQLAARDAARVALPGLPGQLEADALATGGDGEQARRRPG